MFMLSRSRSAFAALLATGVLLGTVSCGGGGDGTATTGAESPPPGGTTTDTPSSPATANIVARGPGPTQLFTAPADPVLVLLAADFMQAQTRLIPTTGGSITATGADGTTFTLTVPDGALLEDTQITLMPVTSAEGLPFSGGLVAAVSLLPDGLFFYRDATLTITPAASVPVSEQVFFGTTGGAGGEMTFVMPAGKTEPVAMRLRHFSAAGLARGTAADTSAAVLRLAIDAEVRISSQVAALFEEARERELAGQSSDADIMALVQQYLDEYKTSVLDPRIQLALSSTARCDFIEDTIRRVLSDSRQRELLGLPSTPLASTFGALVDAKFRTCRQEAIDECKRQSSPSVLQQFDILWLREQVLLGIPAQNASVPLSQAGYDALCNAHPR